MSKTKWTLDASHSEVTFKIKHMMISNVSGSFSNFDVQAETEEEDFTKAKITFTADVNSINTNNEQRDEHLKSADFFDTQKFPQIKFVSTKFDGSESDYKLFGDLLLKK